MLMFCAALTPRSLSAIRLDALIFASPPAVTVTFLPPSWLAMAVLLRLSMLLLAVLLLRNPWLVTLCASLWLVVDSPALRLILLPAVRDRSPLASTVTARAFSVLP